VGTLGNGSFGILIGDSPLNVIGGDAPSEGNVITGNANGISVSNPGSTGNVIKGNLIGPDAAGGAGPGNVGLGVVITAGAQDNTVGPGNVIAYNGWNGVRVIPASSTGNVITKNSIHHNYGDGIALLDGANNNIQPPVITSISAGFPIVIQGTACPFCKVEVFQNSDGDGEGESYVGTDYADGSGAFILLPCHLSKPYLTATATDSTDGTSEFSSVFASGFRSIFLPVVWRGN
jgi:parallel beta-helix repeat protein